MTDDDVKLALRLGFPIYKDRQELNEYIYKNAFGISNKRLYFEEQI